jgi:hypothetical protein
MNNENVLLIFKFARTVLLQISQKKWNVHELYRRLALLAVLLFFKENSLADTICFASIAKTSFLSHIPLTAQMSAFTIYKNMYIMMIKQS